VLAVVSISIAMNTGINSVNAQDYDSLYGTLKVLFEPVQVEGELKACTLVYAASQADHRDGKIIGVGGHIGLQVSGTNLGLKMKVGLKKVEKMSQMVPPHFAYLQTKFHSTAKVEQKAFNADGGRYYSCSLNDKSVMGLYREMMISKKITVGFNREKGGMDVLVPIDLNVIGVESVGDRQVRKRSKETTRNFTECNSKLMDELKHKLEAEKE